MKADSSSDFVEPNSSALWRDYLFCCGDQNAVFDTFSPTSADPSSSTDNQKEMLSLSKAGKAALKTLRFKHFWYNHRLWNVSSGRVVAVHATPRVEHQPPPPHSPPQPPFVPAQAEVETTESSSVLNNTATNAPLSSSFISMPLTTHHDLALIDGHSDWFPSHIGNLISQTEKWCDVLNLGPPDGLFMDVISKALETLHEKKKPITVRMMFGNVIGIGNVNCQAVIKALTANIPIEATQVRLWIGAWRKGVSWNHAKIVAVDGYILLTGGHNLWDEHYLRGNPVLDLSIELEGPVAQDAHLFANEQWGFVENMALSKFGAFVNKIQSNKYAPVVFKSFITLGRFPKSLPRHPPNYVKPKEALLMGRFQRLTANVPMISMGRCGSITPLGRRPSDDAIISILDTATTSIKLAIQDLGPACLPGTRISLPGCVWPRSYLSAVGRVLWNTNAVIDIILSNPLSVPGRLTMMQAMYGNGWTCVDVAAEIIKTVLWQYPIATKINGAKLRDKVSKQMRVCYLRGPDQSCFWSDGKNTRAFHAKHFIVDNRTFYIGSQNLYICDLGEWGVFVDDSCVTEMVLDKFWNPLWWQSYLASDCDVEEVMDSLHVTRNGESPMFMSAATRKQILKSAATRVNVANAFNTDNVRSSKDASASATAEAAHASVAASETSLKKDEDEEIQLQETSSSSGPTINRASDGNGVALSRFRAIGKIAALSQSIPTLDSHNQDFYYLDENETGMDDDDDSDAAVNSTPAKPTLASIATMKFLAKRKTSI